MESIVLQQDSRNFKLFFVLVAFYEVRWNLENPLGFPLSSSLICCPIGHWSMKTGLCRLSTMVREKKSAKNLIAIFIIPGFYLIAKILLVKHLLK